MIDGVLAGDENEADCRRVHLESMKKLSRLGDESSAPSSTTTTATTTTSTTADTTRPSVYIGCYEDPNNSRIFPRYELENWAKLTNSNSPDV